MRIHNDSDARSLFDSMARQIRLPNGASHGTVNGHTYSARYREETAEIWKYMISTTAELWDWQWMRDVLVLIPTSMQARIFVDLPNRDLRDSFAALLARAAINQKGLTKHGELGYEAAVKNRFVMAQTYKWGRRGCDTLEPTGEQLWRIHCNLVDEIMTKMGPGCPDQTFTEGQWPPTPLVLEGLLSDLQALGDNQSQVEPDTTGWKVHLERFLREELMRQAGLGVPPIDLSKVESLLQLLKRVPPGATETDVCGKATTWLERAMKEPVTPGAPTANEGALPSAHATVTAPYDTEVKAGQPSWEESLKPLRKYYNDAQSTRKKWCYTPSTAQSFKDIIENLYCTHDTAYYPRIFPDTHQCTWEIICGISSRSRKDLTALLLHKPNDLINEMLRTASELSKIERKTQTASSLGGAS